MDFKTRLLHYTPRSPLEQKTKDRMLQDLVRYGDALFTREIQHIHFTASAIILNPEMTRTLMIFHNIYQSFCWTGGHADGEQDLLAVAIKEAMEETGVKVIRPISADLLSLDILSVPVHQKNGKHVPAHSHYSAAYGLICDENQPLQEKIDENSAVQWIDIKQLREYCREPHMIPIYEAVISRMYQLRHTKSLALADLCRRLPAWYSKNKRELPWRRDQDPYHVWVSEIMLQQTRVEAVKSYYERFLNVFPDIESLARADEGKLMKCWEGLGYYARARNLKKAAQMVMTDFQGTFPDKYDALLELPGIGPYVAGAIASICFSLPVSAVDGNVLRVVSRVTEEFESIDKPQMKKRISSALQAVYPRENPGDLTQGLMELGATVCLPNGIPKCGECPVQGGCMAHQNGSISILPVRDKKKPRRIEQHTVFVLQAGEKTAVRHRKKAGLLGGLWEFPNVNGKLAEQEAFHTALEWGVMPNTVEHVSERVHVFTHVEWHMTCYYIRCDARPEIFTWAEDTAFRDEIALPTAFRIFLPQMSSDSCRMLK